MTTRTQRIRSLRWLLMPTLMTLFLAALLMQNEATAQSAGTNSKDRSGSSSTAEKSSARVAADKPHAPRKKTVPGGTGHLYSTGYNLYWSRDYEEALFYLKTATQLEDDGRFWLYKGLTEYALGREREAKASVSKAWDLVDQGLTGAQAFNTAMERVQGRTRAWLERVRLEPSLPVETLRPSVAAAPAAPTPTPPAVKPAQPVRQPARQKSVPVAPVPAAPAAPQVATTQLPPAKAAPAKAAPAKVAAVTPPPAKTSPAQPAPAATAAKPAPLPRAVAKAEPQRPKAAESKPAEVKSALPPIRPSAVTLRGTGATFPAPLYERWFSDFRKLHPEVRVTYQALGSGAGVREFIQGQVDFAASDSAMTDEEIAQVENGVVLVPLTAGSVALTYNLPDGPEALNLSREAYTGMYLGQITFWDDPKVVACNPGVQLPHTPVTVMRRSVSSGTTYVFTRHLSSISADWNSGPGVGTTVDWPVGVPAKGNAEIVDHIRQTPGAIGYVEVAYAIRAKLPIAALENKSGTFVKPDLEKSQATLGAVLLPKNLRAWVSDPEGDQAYPIVTYTWLLCYQQYKNPRTAEVLRQFIRYCLTTGQKVSDDLGYVPLPEYVANVVIQAAEDGIGRGVQKTLTAAERFAKAAPREAVELQAANLRGAGATFPAPLYQRWFEEFTKQHPEVKFDYQALGSGAGVRDFIQNKVDFGASDAAMTDEELAQVEKGAVMVPLAAGSIALAYNLPDGPERLQLSREAYAGIFLGRVTTWDAPEIAASNPDVKLPNLPITVVRRAVSSGTTYVFTRHLSSTNSDWSNGPGTGTTVDWPVGVPAKGSSDLVERIRQTPGAIGYVESAHAERAQLAVAALQNKAGEFVRPSLESSRATLASIVLPENLRAWVSDPDGDAAYPIVTYTWVLCYRRYEDPQVGEAVRQFLHYCLTAEGQQACNELGYISLPEDVAEVVSKAVDESIGQPEN